MIVAEGAGELVGIEAVVSAAPVPKLQLVSKTTLKATMNPTSFTLSRFILSSIAVGISPTAFYIIFITLYFVFSIG